MNPYALSIMLSSLAIGTTITLSSHHWILAWMGLEINTLAIIPLMSNPHHPRSTEATTKYFLTQATASTLILFSTLINAWYTGEWEIKETLPLPTNILTIALAMKLGLAPMHFWLPEVLQGLDLMTGLILATWQKIAPMSLIIIMYSSLNPYILTLIGIISTLTGGWGGLNQTQLRKVMAFSSIAHLGWMMIILPYSPQLTLLNFMIYLTMTSSMFLMMKLMNTTKMSSLTISWSKMPIMTALSTTILLSLGGLPPMTGFIPKWLILHELTKQYMMTIAAMMAFSALLSLFFYLRLTYSLSLTQSPNTVNSLFTWHKKPTQYVIVLSLTTILSIMMLPLTPTMM
uniref:NADH-ubiquinone oxidoreductase chain 2 n=1 Tax=Crotaphatrema lamottei TaxID=1043697 RepID=K7NBU0_CROLA|nr:NADH dehydrogenase subunit 2 [Crotaphatrema lamottei]AEK26857.1 NADH dehydrogenase subunit 2 [Crotaphatrema lamottei]